MSTLNTNTNAKSSKKNIRFEHELSEAIEQHKDPLIPFAAWVKQACREKLEREGQVLTVIDGSGDITTSAHSKRHAISDSDMDAILKIQHDEIKKGSANEERAAATRAKLFDALAKLTKDDKSEVLSNRYPKNTLRLMINGIVSKDTIHKYWDEIENLLKS